jgi:hypothetical protein
MAFSGAIPLIGIPGSAITGAAGQGVAQSLSSNFVPFVGSSLNQVAGSAASAVLNIGISQALGTKIAGQSGFDLTAGKNFLASQVTPFLTNTLADGVNTSVTNALKGAGPLAPVLGNLAGQAASNLAQSALKGLGINIPGLGGGVGGGTGAGTQRFPGAGAEGEAPANYGGSAYTLGQGGPDVKFAIRPANTGPQAFGLNLALSGIPSTATTLPANTFSTNPPNIAGLGVDISNFSKVASFVPSSVPLPSADSLKSFWDPTGPISGDALQDSGVGAPPPVWTFICAPENIEWSTQAVVNRAPIFGSNQPPVTVGSKGMRDLTMSNALVEGFVRNVAIEQKIAILEDLLNYTLNTKAGYVNTPVYEVTANNKKYGNGNGGGDGGKFVIKDVKTKEIMRDLSGNATRAMVDISFTQVPAYQVDGGRDQASAPIGNAGKASLLQANAQKALKNQANQGVKTAAKPASGAGSASTRAGGGKTEPIKPVSPVVPQPNQ